MRSVVLATTLALIGCVAHVELPEPPSVNATPAARQAYFDAWATHEDQPGPILEEPEVDATGQVILQVETLRLRNDTVVADPLDLRPLAIPGSTLDRALDVYAGTEARGDFFLFSGTAAVLIGGTALGALAPVIDREQLTPLLVLGGGVMVSGFVLMAFGIPPLVESEQARNTVWSSWDDELRALLDLKDDESPAPEAPPQ